MLADRYVTLTLDPEEALTLSSVLGGLTDIKFADLGVTGTQREMLSEMYTQLKMFRGEME